jgi:tRNA threonylcarbamoyladenosine biosynthesis protein TsaB
MTEKLILGLDTSFGPVSAALVTEGGCVLGVRRIAEAAGQQAELLPPLVGELFASCGLPFSALARVVVTTGPGAFTGVRVGVSFAKGLSIATRADVVGLSSLECLAIQAQEVHAGVRVGVLLDARRDEVYAFVRDSAGSHVLSPSLLSVSEMNSRLGALHEVPLLLFGSGRRLADLPGSVFPEPDVADVDPVTLARFGAALGPSPSGLSLTYLRAPDARLPV